MIPTNPNLLSMIGTALTPDPLDQQLVKLRTMKDSLIDLGRNLDKLIAQRDDLLRLVSDLRKENETLREALRIRVGERN